MLNDIVNFTIENYRYILLILYNIFWLFLAFIITKYILNHFKKTKLKIIIVFIIVAVVIKYPLSKYVFPEITTNLNNSILVTMLEYQYENSTLNKALTLYDKKTAEEFRKIVVKNIPFYIVNKQYPSIVFKYITKRLSEIQYNTIYRMPNKIAAKLVDKLYDILNLLYKENPFLMLQWLFPEILGEPKIRGNNENIKLKEYLDCLAEGILSMDDKFIISKENCAYNGNNFSKQYKKRLLDVFGNNYIIVARKAFRINLNKIRQDRENNIAKVYYEYFKLIYNCPDYQKAILFKCMMQNMLHANKP